MYTQYPYNIFNQSYISVYNLQQYNLQKHIEQQTKVADMVKAISDFCTAAKAVEPEYQQEAFQACIAEIIQQMEMDNQKI